MSAPDRNEPMFEMLQFLRSVSPEPLPDDLTDELDEAAIVTRLQQLGEADDAWIAHAREHEGWIGHVFERLNGNALEHAYRLTQAASGLFDELAEKATDLGLWAALARLALDDRTDLELAERELFEDALRDAAAAGARAWARIDQARCLLAPIDEAADDH